MHFKHGAVLIQGNQILGTGYNIHCCNPTMNTKLSERPRASIHAEASALVHVRREHMIGAVMLVIRVNPQGLLRNSKPCTKCLKLLRRRGIRKVIYSTSAGDFMNQYL